MPSLSASWFCVSLTCFLFFDISRPNSFMSRIKQTSKFFIVMHLVATRILYRTKQIKSITARFIKVKKAPRSPNREPKKNNRQLSVRLSTVGCSFCLSLVKRRIFSVVCYTLICGTDYALCRLNLLYSVSAPTRHSCDRKEGGIHLHGNSEHTVDKS